MLIFLFFKGYNCQQKHSAYSAAFIFLSYLLCFIPTTFHTTTVHVTSAYFQLIVNLLIGFEHSILAEIFRGKYLFNCG